MASRAISITIKRELSLDDLAAPPDAAEIEAAHEDRYLDGNQAFVDLGGMSWANLSETLEIERRILDRLERAPDLDEEEEAVIEELDAEFGADALWGLDPGVASATIALSALGATPVASCNGGVLGGQHKEAYPLVAFYMPTGIAARVHELATAAQAGLIVDDSGRAQIYGGSYRELLRFAELTLEVGGLEAV
ncbi:hypothetical protein [Phenylobacterium sp.]|uniref:hypothetical protein n=1 Tax=Phenylobacterium sp. TaxID=1871053 RepID=UPI001B7A12B7|nr:hypothetical protein [Phenylobacterium sp.]MBP6878281.1 hypothetical protein [Phenylobacterium sp.]